MNSTFTAAERAHVGRVKELACSVCDEPAPSEVHHIEQGQHYTVVALCESCHRDSHMGWHGRKTMWRIKKFTEIDALNVTLGRLMKEIA